jgi:polyhydroxyalkanoate synthesis regulator phasin
MGGYDTVSMYSADITYQRSYSTHNINRFVEQMARQLETHEDRLVEKARQPIDRLFKQQMREMRQDNREETPAYTVMHEVRQQIAEMMRVFIWPAE